MLALDRLLEDLERQRGPLTKRGADYWQVWDAFNRYVTAVVEKRQTLSVANFCKIGWRVEEQLQGKARLRPHFQVAESFARAHGLDLRSQTSVADKYLTTMEELNFSKAAIRYSQTLTKDNIFMGLRAIVQQLGSAIASGQPVCIDFEVGKLVASEREARFVFVADLYLQEGLEVPTGAPEGANYRPSATFAPPSKDALSLSLRGSNQPVGPGETVRATALGGWEDATMAGEEREAGELASEDGGSESTACPPSHRSHASAEDVVHQEALERHVAQMGVEAASAMAEREQWEGHLRRCAAAEQRDAEWRRALHKEHSLQLQHQMRQQEQKRTEHRQLTVEQASLHDFPNFQESPELSVYEYIRERRGHLKQDLDQQVETKQHRRRAEKERERAIDLEHVQASQRELALMKLEAAAKKEGERATLSNAWEKDKHLHSVRKAIHEHHRAPGKSSAELPQALHSTLGGGLPLGSLPSPRSEASGPPSSRPITGSVRRMPLGAAASLALHKERLSSGFKR